MAKIKITMPSQFLDRVSRLADRTDAIVEKSLEAGGKVVLEKVRGNLRAVIGKGVKYGSRSTGELVSSLGLSPVKVSHKGEHNIKVGFSEPRRHRAAAKRKRSYSAVTNAMLANLIEYGKQGQPAKPFLKPARSSSRKACIEAMQEVIDREVQQL